MADGLTTLNSLLWGTSTGGTPGSGESILTLGADRVDARPPPDVTRTWGLQLNQVKNLALAMSSAFKGRTRLQSDPQTANPFGSTESGFYIDGAGQPWSVNNGSRSSLSPTAGLQYFNAADYGASAATADNGPAINLAIAAATSNHGSNAKGGVVYLPPGQFGFSTPLNLQAAYGVRFLGTGGLAPGSPKGATVLNYTGTGSTPAIQANASIGCQFIDLAITYSNSGFTGILIDFSQGALGSGGAYANIERCYIGTNWNDNVNCFGASSLISLDNMVDCWIDQCNLVGAFVGIHLRDSSGHFANSIKIRGNRFSDFQTAAITNGSQQLTIDDNTFENNPLMIAYNSGHPGTYPTMAPSFAAEVANMPTQGVAFTGNYLGDGDGSKPVIDLTNVALQGAQFSGNFIAGNIALGSCAGVSIGGNSFNGVTFTFPGTTFAGVVIGPNATVGTVTLTSPPASGVTFLNNNDIAGAHNLADKIATVGDLTLAPATGNILPPTDSSQTWGSTSLRIQQAFIKTVSAAAAGLSLIGGNTSYVLNATGFDIGTASTIFPLGNINASKVQLGKTTTVTQLMGGMLGAVTSVSDAAYTALVGDYFIAYTALTAGRTVTIPTAAAGNKGQVYIVKNQSAGAFAITISPATGTVDGAASVATTAAGRAPAVRVYSDGAAWYTF